MRATRGACNPNLQECTLVRTQFDHVCFDHLSRKTYAKHSITAKVFGPLIVVAHTPKLLVITSINLPFVFILYTKGERELMSNNSLK